MRMKETSEKNQKEKNWGKTPEGHLQLQYASCHWGQISIPDTLHVT